MRALLSNRTLLHTASALCRHARLVGRDARRAAAHGEGALTRYLAILLRFLTSSRSTPRPSPKVRAELRAHVSRVESLLRSPVELGRFEAAVLALCRRLWEGRDDPSGAPSQDRGPAGQYGLG